jgi:hypothetical protein
MSSRFIASMAVFAAMLAAGQTAAPAPKSPAAAAKKNWTVPRTADGHPDLQGTWSNATLTPVERPSKFAGKATISLEEAKNVAQKDIADVNAQDGQSDGALIAAAGSAGTGGYNVLFLDRGSMLAVVDGVARTSLVIDPPDGKVPPMTPAARERNNAMFRNFNNYDSVKNRPLSERCIIGFGSTSGPPMLPNYFYNNNYQIVQTPDRIMILVEMVHDVRTIRMNGTHPPKDVQQWLGDSIGHWEGDTLVVETTNFNDQTRFRGASTDLKVTERFTRISADTILYRATIEDPSSFARPWTMEYPFLATTEPIYEYACHEGNYAMTDILGGARLQESTAAKKK